MGPQMIDTNFSECRLNTAETNFSSHEKHQSVAVKKAVLREVHNENRLTIPNLKVTSPCTKDRGSVTDDTMLPGTKRPSPDTAVKSPQRQTPTVVKGYVVYVRRKRGAESCKGMVCERTSIQSDCQQPEEPNHHPDDSTQLNPNDKESKSPCFPASSPVPVGSSVGPLAKPSSPLGELGMKSTSIESYHQLTGPALPSLKNSKGGGYWEERCHQLQSLLQKLDQSDQEDNLQMLRSLSSVELSSYAVALEKRSMQISCEEAKEMRRADMLGVLGKKHAKTAKEASDHRQS